MDDYDEDEKNDYRHTTTTTTTTTRQTAYANATDGPSYPVIVTAQCNMGYLRTLGGMLKCIAIALCFICLFCVTIGGPGYYSGVGWATFVTCFGIFVSLSLLCLYMFRVVDAMPSVPWIVAEMIYCFMWTIFFFIAGCVLAVAATQFHSTFGWAAAAFFAFGAMCTYGFDCYLKFLAWRNGELATGAGPGDPATATLQQRGIINP